MICNRNALIEVSPQPSPVIKIYTAASSIEILFLIIALYDKNRY